MANAHNYVERHYLTFISACLIKQVVTNLIKGPFMCYVTQMGVGVSDFLEKKRYEGVMFNVISVTRGWMGSNFQKKIALRKT